VTRLLALVWPDLRPAPVTVELMYDTSWSGIRGLSRPQRARTSSITEGDRFGFLSRIRSGDPGISRNSTKLSRMIANTVTIACTSLRLR